MLASSLNFSPADTGKIDQGAQKAHEPAKYQRTPKVDFWEVRARKSRTETELSMALRSLRGCTNSIYGTEITLRSLSSCRFSVKGNSLTPVVCKNNHEASVRTGFEIPNDSVESSRTREVQQSSKNLSFLDCCVQR